jgi:hypothetical protein
MGQPYQGGRPVVLPRWGWSGMMPWHNVAMHITTMVGVGDGSPPYVGDKFLEPSNKGQPNGSSHSTGAHEWRPRGPSNPKRAKMGIGSMGARGKPPRWSILAMTTPVWGPWRDPPWMTWYLPWYLVAPNLPLITPTNQKSLPYPIYNARTDLNVHV